MTTATAAVTTEHMRMIPHSFSGSFRLVTEARLCGNNAPQEGPHPSIVAANDFFASMLRPVNDFISGTDTAREAIRKQNVANLQSEIAWVRAFQAPDVFTAPPRDRSSLPQSITPADLLSTLTPQERVNAFYRFTRSVLGSNNRIFREQPVRPEFLYPGFQNDTIDPATRLDAPTDEHRRFILRVLGRLAGTDTTASPDVDDVVRNAFRDLYPIGSQGFLYEDFRKAVDDIRREAAAGVIPPPTPGDLQNPAYLLERLRSRPSRLTGFLQVMSSGGDDRRKELQATLQPLMHLVERRDKINELSMLSAHQQYDKLSANVRENVERGNRTFTENFSRLPQWQQFAAIGLGAYALYRIWNSKNRLINTGIPLALGGTYLYLLSQGDRNPLTTMVNSGGGMLTKLGDTLGPRLRGIGEGMGLLRPDTVALDRNRMDMMGRYLDQKAFMALNPNTLPFMTLSEVEMRHLTGGFRITYNTEGAVSTSLFAEPRDPLHTSMEGVIRTRRYDRQTVFSLFHQNNREISGALGTVFYQLAGRDPANREQFQMVEKNRRASSIAEGGPNARMHSSIEMVNNGDARRAYVDLVRKGMTIAQQRHPTKKFHELIAELLNVGPELRPDLAEQITPADRAARRPGEHAVLSLNAVNALDPRREESRKLLRAEFEESVNHRIARFMDAGALTRFREATEPILTSTRPLPELRELLQRLEYAVLVAALKKGNAMLTVDDINDIVGNTTDPTWLQTLGGSLTNWLNRTTITVASNFQNVENIDNVLAVLSRRLGAEVTGIHFENLRKELTTRQQQIRQLRTAESMQTVLVDSLTRIDPAAITRMGGRTRALDFARRMTARDDYIRMFSRLEQAYAQSVATDVAEAMLVTHRRDGDHTLDSNPNDRLISPIEEANITALARNRFEQMFGPANRPLNGMGSAMFMRELLSSYDPRTALTPEAAENGPKRDEAVNHVRMIATLYLGMQPIPEQIVPASVAAVIANPLSAPVVLTTIDVHLRSRVHLVAQRLMGITDAGTRASGDYALQCRDVARTMELLNMTAGPYLASYMAVLSASELVSVMEGLRKNLVDSIQILRKQNIDAWGTEARNLNSINQPLAKRVMDRQQSILADMEAVAAAAPDGALRDTLINERNNTSERQATFLEEARKEMQPALNGTDAGRETFTKELTDFVQAQQKALADLETELGQDFFRRTSNGESPDTVLPELRKRAEEARQLQQKERQVFEKRIQDAVQGFHKRAVAELEAFWSGKLSAVNDQAGVDYATATTLLSGMPFTDDDLRSQRETEVKTLQASYEQNVKELPEALSTASQVRKMQRDAAMARLRAYANETDALRLTVADPIRIAAAMALLRAHVNEQTALIDSVDSEVMKIEADLSNRITTTNEDFRKRILGVDTVQLTRTEIKEREWRERLLKALASGTDVRATAQDVANERVEMQKTMAADRRTLTEQMATAAANMRSAITAEITQAWNRLRSAQENMINQIHKPQMIKTLS